jgi:diacylglycerol kinase family enzyme
MKHLFIINPEAMKNRGKVSELKNEIESFFSCNKHLEYDIHVTRWNRDATGYVRNYVRQARQAVRVHSCGGAGTLFEVVNAAAGLKGVQVAAYPLGASNEFLAYFGRDKEYLFRSIQSQVASGTTPIDTIRHGNLHGISHVLVGMEARSNRDGLLMLERTKLPADFCYTWPAILEMLSGESKGQKFTIDLDGMPLGSKYITMLIANSPVYGKDMCPAIDAHPNDGLFNVYMMVSMNRFKALATVPVYLSGNYRKIPNRVLHYSGKKIKISSDEVMCYSFEGETFYEESIELEIIHHSINFVCSQEIDLLKLPRIFKHPEEGLVGDWQNK